MIDEQKIDGRREYGTQFDVGNIALRVITEIWGGDNSWHTPTILMSRIERQSLLDPESLIVIKYDALESIATAFTKAAREWERLEEWRREKNSENLKKRVGAV